MCANKLSVDVKIHDCVNELTNLDVIAEKNSGNDVFMGERRCDRFSLNNTFRWRRK